MAAAAIPTSDATIELTEDSKELAETLTFVSLAPMLFPRSSLFTLESSN